MFEQEQHRGRDMIKKVNSYMHIMLVEFFSCYGFLCIRKFSYIESPC
jgi:hypothetical protein